MDHRLIIDGDLVLYGFVGDSFWMEGFSSKEVVAALEQMDGDINVRINSGGGIAEEGVAIYHALRAYSRGTVTTHVDAIAASAASVIAMGGDEIVIPEASLLMIHNASGVTVGDNRAHRKTASVLDKINAQIATIYAAQTGDGKAAMLRLMAEETWLSGSEAVEQGFAHTAPGSDVEDEVEPTAFDYRIYAHAPEKLVQFSNRAHFAAHNTENLHMANPKAPGKDAGPTKATAEELTAAYPETIEAIRAEAKAEGKAEAEAALPVNGDATAEAVNLDEVRAEAAKAERERIEGIEALAVPGCEKLVDEMKADGKTTPEAAAVRILKAVKAKGSAHLADLAAAEAEVKVDAAPTDGTEEADATASTASTPEEWENEWKASDKLRREFAEASDYVAFKKAETGGRVRFLRKAS